MGNADYRLHLILVLNPYVPVTYLVGSGGLVLVLTILFG